MVTASEIKGALKLYGEIAGTEIKCVELPAPNESNIGRAVKLRDLGAGCFEAIIFETQNPTAEQMDTWNARKFEIAKNPVTVERQNCIVWLAYS